MRNKRPNADNRVVDVLGKLVADCLADFYVGLCRQDRWRLQTRLGRGTVSRSQTMTLGFHAGRSVTQRPRC